MQVGGVDEVDREDAIARLPLRLSQDCLYNLAEVKGTGLITGYTPAGFTLLVELLPGNRIRRCKEQPVIILVRIIAVQCSLYSVALSLHFSYQK